MKSSTHEDLPALNQPEKFGSNRYANFGDVFVKMSNRQVGHTFTTPLPLGPYLWGFWAWAQFFTYLISFKEWRPLLKRLSYPKLWLICQICEFAIFDNFQNFHEWQSCFLKLWNTLCFFHQWDGWSYFHGGKSWALLYTWYLIKLQVYHEYIIFRTVFRCIMFRNITVGWCWNAIFGDFFSTLSITQFLE